MKKWIVMAFVIVILGAGLLWLRYQVGIDGCLDSGGRWDYAIGTCAR